MAAGEEVRLECEVSEAGEVLWLKGMEPIQPNGRFQVLTQGQRQTLVIRGFSAEDQGEYRCGTIQGPASTEAAAFQGASSWGPAWEGLGHLGGLALHARGPPGELSSHHRRLRWVGLSPLSEPLSLGFRPGSP